MMPGPRPRRRRPDDPRRRGVAVLSPSQQTLLHGLLRARVASTGQLRALYATRPGGGHHDLIPHRLRGLHAEGLVEATRQLPGRGGRLWWATSAGAAAAAALAGEPVDRARLVDARQVTIGAHEPTVTVNDVGVALIGWARRLGDDVDPATWTVDVDHSHGLTADAVVTYGHRSPTDPDDPRGLDLVVLLDHGRQSSKRLLSRLLAWDRYRRSGGWTDHYPWSPAGPDEDPVFPAIVVISAGGSRHGSATGRVRDLVAACQRTPKLVDTLRAGLDVTFTTLDDLVHYGPLSPIFVDPVARRAGRGWQAGHVDLLGNPDPHPHRLELTR